MASSAPVPTIGEVVEGLIQYVEIVQLVKLFSLSSMVLYLYNYVLTLDDEISLMWSAAGLRLGKLLYFVLRYCTLFSTIYVNIGLFNPSFTVEVSYARNIYYWVSAVVIALATDFVLQLRVYALYQRSRTILCLIIVSSCAMIASFATFLTIILRADVVKKTYLGPGTNEYICEGSTLPAVYDKIWVAKLVNEALMFFLALNKGIESLQQNKGMGAASRLMVALVEDSVYYFLVVFAFCLMSQLVWTYAGQHYIEVSTGLTLAVGSIMSQRLMVNIRKQVQQKELDSIGSRSEMRYGRPSEIGYTVDGRRTNTNLVGAHSYSSSTSSSSEV